MARSRFAPRLVWPLCALGVAGALAIVVLDVLDRARIHSFSDLWPVGIVLPVSFSLLGAILVSRRPGNRVGWIFLLIGVVGPWSSLGGAYYERSVVVGGLPGAQWAAWLSDWGNLPVFPAGLALFAFLLFPSGRLPSRRWRPVAWLALLMSSLGIALAWLDPSPITVLADLPDVANPTGVAALGPYTNGGVGNAWWLIGLLLIAMTIGSLVVRGRRADRLERQQVKILAYAAALTIGFLTLQEVVSIAGGSVGSGWTGDAAVVLGFGIAVPVACGIAVLRHGLYEIDQLISRTLSYTLVTGVLVGVFVGIVVLLTDVLPFSSPVAVAASTLAAAALFNPLRLRTQRLIDRRFNRARYDAQATVAAFSGRLRNAVDLDTIRDEFLHAVDQAVAPAHVSLWIQPSTAAISHPR